MAGLPVNDEPSSAARPARWWPWLGGPLLTLLTLSSLAMLSDTPQRIQNPAAVFLIPVVFSAYTGGLGPGLLSAAMSLLFCVRFYSEPGQLLHFSSENLRRFLLLVVATPTITVMVGLLKRREQRRMAAMAAVRAAEHYRELVDDIDGVVWEADASVEPFRFTFVSRRAEAIMGHPPSSWLEPDFWLRRIHPEDRERVLEFARYASGASDHREIVYRVVSAAGRTVWLRDRMHGVTGEGGTGGRLRGVMLDITDLRLAEEAMIASEARKGAILEGALDCIVTIDHLGNVLDFNPTAERTFGHRRTDVLGRPMVDLIVPPGLRDAHRQGFARHLATGEARVIGRRIEMTALRADGSEFPVELAVTRIPGADPPVFTGFLRDITERRAAMEELRGTLSLLTATLESTADGILVVDRHGKIVSLNRKFVVMWRIPQTILDTRDDEQAIAFVLSQLKDPEAFVSKVRDLYSQPESESFDVLEFKDGRVFERYSLPQRIDGRSVGRVWSFRDVTERRRAEAELRESELQLRQSHKMEAVGRLAGGVAHDFNNLLTVILGYCDTLIERIDPSDPMRHAADEILDAAERAASLTRQLLAFSRRQILEPKVVNLNVALASIGQMLRRLIGEDIALDLKLDPDLGRVVADEQQIHQVIMNLAINARDAMPQGGRLTIATANAELDDSYAFLHPPLPAGPYIMLTVSDSGMGMDAETRTRIFEPFFTTKEQGKGTGLGLATVYGIVKQSGGFIWVYSEPGEGSVFKVYLPRLDAAEIVHEEAVATSRPPGGTETVLLVEDEAKVRELLCEALERHGYRVLAAGSGEQALEVMSAHPAPLDLLVTDVVMPGMRGPELAARLGSMHPRMRVLHISGYADDEVLRHGVRAGLTSFLQKPFTVEALIHKIREVLDAPQPA